jgi:hypothetical protein
MIISLKKPLTKPQSSSRLPAPAKTDLEIVAAP